MFRIQLTGIESKERHKLQRAKQKAFISILLAFPIFIISMFFSNIQYIGPYFNHIAAMLAVFVAPAAGLLAIRAIWDAGKTEDIERVIQKQGIPTRKEFQLLFEQIDTLSLKIDELTEN